MTRPHPDTPTFTYDLPIEIENHKGWVVTEYQCRVTYEIGEGDVAIICKVEVQLGDPFGWQDADRVLDPDEATALYDNAGQIGSIQQALLEHARDSSDWAADNADAQGHAHRERMEESR